MQKCGGKVLFFLSDCKLNDHEWLFVDSRERLVGN